jgi:hypothetical protein
MTLKFRLKWNEAISSGIYSDSGKYSFHIKSYALKAAILLDMVGFVSSHETHYEIDIKSDTTNCDTEQSLGATLYSFTKLGFLVKYKYMALC